MNDNIDLINLDRIDLDRLTMIDNALNEQLVVSLGDRCDHDLGILKTLLRDGLAELAVLPARGLTIYPTEKGMHLLDTVRRIRHEETAEALRRTEARIAEVFTKATT